MEKRRKKIVAGLAVVMALVSKSIYAQQLPMVTTTRTEAKYIEHIVEAEGIVEAGAKLPVTVLSGLRVEELVVHTGDQVKEGDLLFTVDLEDLKQIMDEQELSVAKTQLQIDTIVHNKELSQNQKALEEARAREDYDALARYQDTLVGRAAEDVVQAEKALEELPDESKGNGSEEDALQEDNADATLAVYRTELAAMQDKLAAYREVLDREGKMTAPMAGTVTDVYVQAGGRVPDTASFLLADEEVACRFRTSLTKEQKSYVNLGDDVKLELGGSRKIDVKVDYLQENESMPGTYTAVVKLPEETGVPGLSGKLTCSKTGEKYPACIPLSALHSENGRYFVYVVNEREGILGTEYYVEEITISVVDKNDRLAAIEGAVSDESLILESSTKEVQKGTVVRLADG